MRLQPVSRVPAPALLEALPDTVVVADGAGHIAYVNPAVRVLLGHDAEDLVGRPLTVLMPARLRAGHGEGHDLPGSGSRPCILARVRSGRAGPGKDRNLEQCLAASVRLHCPRGFKRRSGGGNRVEDPNRVA